MSGNKSNVPFRPKPPSTLFKFFLESFLSFAFKTEGTVKGLYYLTKHVGEWNIPSGLLGNERLKFDCLLRNSALLEECQISPTRR